MKMTTLRRGRTQSVMLTLGLCVATGLSITACSTGSHEAASASNGATAGPTSPPSSAPSGSSQSGASANGGSASAKTSPGKSTYTGRPRSSPTESAGKATRPPNQVAGKVMPVIRNGKRPDPSISAKPKSFHKAVHYRDGLSLKVEKIKQGVQSGYGRGVFHGSPQTQLVVKLTNGTNKAMNLTNVVVQMRYGSPARLASPVYDKSSADFHGVVKSGRSQTATYVFSVPKKQLGDVMMTVDMDAAHTVAIFEGSATS